MIDKQERFYDQADFAFNTTKGRLIADTFRGEVGAYIGLFLLMIFVPIFMYNWPFILAGLIAYTTYRIVKTIKRKKQEELETGDGIEGVKYNFLKESIKQDINNSQLTENNKATLRSMLKDIKPEMNDENVHFLGRIDTLEDLDEKELKKIKSVMGSTDYEDSRIQNKLRWLLSMDRDDRNKRIEELDLRLAKCKHNFFSRDEKKNKKIMDYLYGDGDIEGVFEAPEQENQDD